LARPASVRLLLTQDRRQRWTGHRALLHLPQLAVTRTAVEEMTERGRAHGRIALLEEPGNGVVVQERLPRHHVPPTDSSAMSSVGLPMPLGDAYEPRRALPLGALLSFPAVFRLTR